MKVTIPRDLSTLDDLATAVSESFVRPVLIFKHSSRCGTSAYAQEELLTLLDGPPLEAAVFVVHIQGARAVSDAIAARFKLRHESPQVLLIRDGELRWHRSHFRVTAGEMAEALRQVSVAP